jgi:hypothetical protein
MSTIEEFKRGFLGVSGVDSASLAAVIHAATEKATPVDNDEVAIIDSEDGDGLKKTLWSSIKATLKTYFDTLYDAVGAASTAQAAAEATASADATSKANAVAATVPVLSVHSDPSYWLVTINGVPSGYLPRIETV